mgnify:CR=1 FL=1
MKKFSFTINSHPYDVEIKSIEDNLAEVEVNGVVYAVQFDRQLETTKTPKLVIPVAVPSTSIAPSEVKTTAPAKPKSVGTGGTICSPLPGVIRGVFVNVGDKIKFGDKLLNLEAMQMENIINSDKEGTITAINVTVGATVLEGHVLIELSK